MSYSSVIDDVVVADDVEILPKETGRLRKEFYPASGRAIKQMTDCELCERSVHALDAEAFGEYAVRLVPRLKKFAMKFVDGSEDRADDVVQLSLLQAMRSLSSTAQSPNGEGSFCQVPGYLSTWLHSIVRNAAFYDRERTHFMISLSDMGGDQDGDSGGNDGAADALINQSLSAQFVMGSGIHMDPLRIVAARQECLQVADLAETNRNIGLAVAYSCNECEYQDLARLHDVPEGTIKSRISRGRQMLFGHGISPPDLD